MNAHLVGNRWKDARARTVVAASLLGFAGALTPDLFAEAKPDTRSCSAIVVTADDQTPAKGGPSFSAGEILDVKVRIVFPASVRSQPGDILSVEVRTPNGYLYQTIETPVSDAGSSEKERRVDGYPFPLKVQALAVGTGTDKGARILEVRLPVGGTSITESGLYGAWSVRAWLGAAPACDGRFTLRP
jgi:hypothetical protein